MPKPSTNDDARQPFWARRPLTTFAIAAALLACLPALLLVLRPPGIGTPAATWRTLAPAATLTRIGFGSCLDQRRPMPIWKTILADRPDLFLMLGDNVYGDFWDAEAKLLRDAYARLAANAGFGAARAALPFLATWDDHDYGSNDGGAGFPHRKTSEAIFRGFWGKSAPAEFSDGVHYARTYGPPGRRVQIIMLDTRSFRSDLVAMSAVERTAAGGMGKYKPDPTPEKTMLGAAQWAWLEAKLREPAEVRLLVSSVQVLARGHGWERWGHLPAEKAKLLRLIEKTGAKGVLLLSGDRHRAAIYRHAEGMRYPVFEVTSSSLNRSFAGQDPADAGRIGEMFGKDNSGLVEIDWPGQRLTISIRGLDGRAAMSRSLELRELGHSVR